MPRQRPNLFPWATWIAANGSTSKVYAHPMTAADRTYLKKGTNRYKIEQLIDQPNTQKDRDKNLR